MQLSEVPYDREFSVRQRVENAAMCLQMLDEPRQRGITHTVAIAIQQILSAAYSADNLASIAPEAAAKTARLMEAACPAVAEAMAGKMALERIYFLMGAAAGLLTVADDPFRADRIDYAGMLAAELSLSHHSKTISERGFPLLRAARIASAWAEPRDPSQPLH
jgi:hypothetical protein